MNLPFSIFVGLRYIRAKRRNQFLSFISLIALMGMTMGVVALIVVLSVMNGFEAELRGRVLSLVPHAYLESTNGSIDDWQLLAERFNDNPQVLGVAPFIGGEAMLSMPGVVRGIQLTGIDPEFENAVSVIDKNMLAGTLADLEERRYGVVLGALIARHMGLTVGDSVTIVIPKVSVTPAGIFPRSRRFTVVGVFEVGAQVDSNTAFIHIGDAARLFAMKGQVQGLRIQTSDLYRVNEILASTIASLSGEYQIQDWSKSQGSLFQAVRMEKTMIAVLLTTVVAVAAFNIISILTMMVTEKRADIAVLRTMGASPYAVMAVFIVQGMGIGVLGVVIGGIVGVLAALNISELVSAIEDIFHIYVFDPRVYFITKIPSVLQWLDVLRIISGALLLSFLATLYPAYRASEIEPAEALRYE